MLDIFRFSRQKPNFSFICYLAAIPLTLNHCWRGSCANFMLITAFYLLRLKVCFFLLGFLSRTFTNHRTAGGGESISLAPHCLYDLPYRHLHVNRVITAESSPLDIASNQTRIGLEPLVPERKLLTTMLRS